MNPALAKWFDIFFGVVAYELQHGNDGFLLSQECDRWIKRHPILARAFIAATGTVLTLHLANLVPVEYDLMHKGLWRKVIEWATVLTRAGYATG